LKDDDDDDDDDEVVDEEDGILIRRVTSNVLNRQSQRAENGWSSSFGLGGGLTTPYRKKQLVTKCYTGPRKWRAFVIR